MTFEYDETECGTIDSSPRSVAYSASVNRVGTGSDNGLSPIRRQATT